MNPLHILWVYCVPDTFLTVSSLHNNPTVIHILHASKWRNKIIAELTMSVAASIRAPFSQYFIKLPLGCCQKVATKQRIK